MDFAGKVALVTGASSGMGREIAIRFAAAGAAVMVNYVASEKGAKETLALIEKAGGKAALCQADVSDAAEAERLTAATAEKFGRLDYLVNNAGVTRFIPFSDLAAADAEVWKKLYEVNVMGPFFCARAAAPHMRKHGGGAVVNNASVSGHRPNGSSIPYVTSKAALLHMTRCLAKTLGPEIRVNSISPGFIGDTRWHMGRTDFDKDATYASGAELSAVKRVGNAKDVAGAALFLCSEDASFCTGIDIIVDGGRFMYV